MKFLKSTGIVLLVLALLGAAAAGYLNHIRKTASLHQVVSGGGGTKVSVEELSYFDGLDKTFGKIYRPAEGEGPFPTVIVCHDLGMTGEWGDAFCRLIAGRGFCAYAFDFKGGSPDSRSSGATTDMSVVTEKEDLLRVIRRIRKEKFSDRDRLFIMGHGAGGLAAALAAQEMRKDIAGLVLLAPAFNLPDAAAVRYPKRKDIPDTTVLNGMTVGRKFFRDLENLHPYKWLKRYSKPVLVFQAEEDATVPEEYVIRCFESFSNAELETVAGADHRFSGKMSSINKQTAAWLERKI